MRSTPLLVLSSLLAFASVSSSARPDQADNQIDELGLQMGRGRYNIRACKPCEQNQCQVMGKLVKLFHAGANSVAFV